MSNSDEQSSARLTYSTSAVDSSTLQSNPEQDEDEGIHVVGIPNTAQRAVQAMAGLQGLQALAEMAYQTTDNGSPVLESELRNQDMDDKTATKRKPPEEEKEDEQPAKKTSGIPKIPPLSFETPQKKLTKPPIMFHIGSPRAGSERSQSVISTDSQLQDAADRGRQGQKPRVSSKTRNRSISFLKIKSPRDDSMTPRSAEAKRERERNAND